jgi:hypothetical protein
MTDGQTIPDLLTIASSVLPRLTGTGTVDAPLILRHASSELVAMAAD